MLLRACSSSKAHHGGQSGRSVSTGKPQQPTPTNTIEMNYIKQISNENTGTDLHRTAGDGHVSSQTSPTANFSANTLTASFTLRAPISPFPSHPSCLFFRFCYPSLALSTHFTTRACYSMRATLSLEPSSSFLPLSRHFKAS